MLLVLALVVSACSSDKTSAPTRADFVGRVSLNGIWKFQADPDDAGTTAAWFASAYDDGEWLDAVVPGNWNYLFRSDRTPTSATDYDGVAWYRTTFTPDASMKGSVVKLHFGAVSYTTKVWLNGEPIGEHEGDFVPFEFDVSRGLRFGEENVLALRVEALNANSVGTIPPATGRYDYWIFSGVHRDVYLEATSQVSVFDVFAYGDPTQGRHAPVHVDARLLNASAESFTVSVRVQVMDAGETDALVSELRRVVIPERSAVTVSTDLIVPNAKAWSLSSPALYTCRVEVLAEGEGASAMAEDTLAYDPSKKLAPHASLSLLETSDAVDAVETRFGIRKIEVSGREILLNGERVHFRGVNRHDEYPMMGRVVPDNVYREDLRKLKIANVNAIRTAHYPNEPRLYRLCDELGFLVVEEAPVIAILQEEMKTQPIKDLALDYTRRMVHRDKNHPSIVIWSAADEPEPYADSDFNSLQYAAMKAIDPTRLVTYARVMMDLFAEDPDADLVMLNPYYGWYVGEPYKQTNYLQTALEKWDKPIVLGEFGSGATPGLRSNASPETSDHYTEDYQAYQLYETWRFTEAVAGTSGGFVRLYADFISPTREFYKSMQYPTSHKIPNPVPYNNLKGIVDRNRVPKNAFLTVMGMFGGGSLHHLTIDVLAADGTPAVGAKVTVVIDDEELVASQVSDESGKIVLWYIPELAYTVTAKVGSASATGRIQLGADETLTLRLVE